MKCLSLSIAFILIACSLSAQELLTAEPIGTTGSVGTLDGPRSVNRLEITKPGVYENYIIDGKGASGNLVKITADNVTIRHCEIRNGSTNGIGVFGNAVLIEHCLIHHMLAGSFKEQHDAHGIAGRWGDVVIRNCNIGYTSGDSIQFDPDRKSSGSLVIENCELWTGPLPAASAGFKAGERPGENAVDTKVKTDGPRCRLVVRNCYLHGWNQSAPISNAAALNLKENVDAEVSRCVFHDNEIAIRARGPGSRGGAHVSIVASAIYDATVGIRVEDRIEKLHIERLAFGEGVGERIKFVNGQPTSGYSNRDEQKAPPISSVLQRLPPAR